MTADWHQTWNNMNLSNIWPPLGVFRWTTLTLDHLISTGDTQVRIIRKEVFYHHISGPQIVSAPPTETKMPQPFTHLNIQTPSSIPQIHGNLRSPQSPAFNPFSPGFFQPDRPRRHPHCYAQYIAICIFGILRHVKESVFDTPSAPNAQRNTVSIKVKLHLSSAKLGKLWKDTEIKLEKELKRIGERREACPSCDWQYALPQSRLIWRGRAGWHNQAIRRIDLPKKKKHS